MHSNCVRYLFMFEFKIEWKRRISFNFLKNAFSSVSCKPFSSLLDFFCCCCCCCLNWYCCCRHHSSRMCTLVRQFEIWKHEWKKIWKKVKRKRKMWFFVSKSSHHSFIRLVIINRGRIQNSCYCEFLYASKMWNWKFSAQLERNVHGSMSAGRNVNRISSRIVFVCRIYLTIFCFSSAIFFLNNELKCDFIESLAPPLMRSSKYDFIANLVRHTSISIK